MINRRLAERMRVATQVQCLLLYSPSDITVVRVLVVSWSIEDVSSSWDLHREVFTTVVVDGDDVGSSQDGGS